MTKNVALLRLGVEHAQAEWPFIAKRLEDYKELIGAFSHTCQLEAFGELLKMVYATGYVAGRTCRCKRKAHMKASATKGKR